MKLILYIVVFFFWGNTDFPLINELCSNNDEVIADEDGDFSDWIEIYNDTADTISLHHYYLSDDETTLDKWHFPTFLLAPHNYVLVFASEKNRTTNEWHCNFKISAKGESIYLSNADKEIVQEVNCPALKADHSFGLNDSTFRYFTKPTPLQSNHLVPSYAGYAPQPIFSIDETFISKGSLLEITCDSLFDIYYSLDGAYPYPKGKFFQSAITIDSTASVKAICYQSDYILNQTNTKTYFVDEKGDLPIIHINVEPNLFFNDTTGIHATGLAADTIWPFFGANYWWDKEVPVHFEYYDPLHQNYFQENCVVEIHGGKASRTNPMRSLRLEADEDYGTKKFEFPFFESRDIDEFYRLVLRNASGDFNQAHCRDALVAHHVLKEGLLADALAQQAINVFINGQYWGLHYLRERYDKYYFKTKYKLNITPHILEKDTGIIEGNRDGFDKLYQKILVTNYAENENFETIIQNFDITNFNDYFITELFFNNTDWPRNNIKYWQHPNDLKWRYVLFDFDVSMNLLNWNNAEYNFMESILAETYDETHANILRNFLDNKNFKEQFINRFADLLNTSFQTKKLHESLDEMLNLIEPEINRQLNQWNGNRIEWESQIDTIRSFLNQKPAKQFEFINQQFDLKGTYDITVEAINNPNAEVNINTLQQVALPFEGKYFSDNPIKLTVKSNNNELAFKYWHDELNDNYYIDQELIFDSNKPAQLNAVFIQKESKIVAYDVNPQLINNQFVVEYPDKKFMMRLINSYGQTVFSKRFYPGSQTNNIWQVDSATFASGIYFLLIQDESGSTVFKLVKM